MRNHKRKCETNRSSAFHITPKRGNVGNPSSLLKFRPMDNIPTIMHYELCIMNFALFMTRTSVRLYERVGFTRCVDFPNNYELCITHYEFYYI